MTTFHSVNPATHEVLGEWPALEDAGIESVLVAAQSAFAAWSRTRPAARALVLQEIGAALLKRVQQDLLEHGAVEQQPLMEGKQMIMVIGPRKR